MDTIKYILEEGGYQGMLAMSLIAIAYLVLENRLYKKQNVELNKDIQTILQKTTEITEKVIASGELHTVTLKSEIAALRERIEGVLINLKK